MICSPPGRPTPPSWAPNTGAEVEDMADSRCRAQKAARPRDLLEGCLVVHVVGRGVERRPLVHDRLQVGGRSRSCGSGCPCRPAPLWQNTALSPVSASTMNSWLRSPPIGPVSARIGIAFRPMREGAQVGHEHLVVGVDGALLVDVEGVVVLHQELAAAHHAEARADLVTELPLDVIEVPAGRGSSSRRCGRAR